ncbi:AmmeMemoRadiSam system radical SAM enzyme [Candidatus Hecatella orcuttiae]|uniref:AmmeMemoRadiSam system radical SAM enzyme n=1 Tax=Candidatus Hecatella orcuttiae TaxID=1935119 RepID=UPI0028683A2F|nr:AmmeMemoRadiSam system radical SAM enzyme [Candidatus Hecatella orcuttiae]
MEARLYQKIREDGLVKCIVCGRRCYIADGKRGFCRVRENRGGTLYVLNYAKLTAMNVDPIEKKPLFNFWPGSLSFSISSISCSLTCEWCQNYSLSQVEPGEIPVREVSPEEVVEMAKRYGCKTIAYTYNEPIIWLEYVVDTAKAARKQNILNVLVTNGYATEESIREFSPYIDAANVDIKAFHPEFYSKHCQGRLEDVLNSVKLMVKEGWHVETTYLLIPGLNDRVDEIRKMSRWVVEELGADTPLHFSQFYPMYKMTHLPPTPVGTLVKAREIALKEGLHYVYVGNVPGHEGENTYCPGCGSVLVQRWGFDVQKWRLTEKMTCSYCGTRIAIKGKFEPRKKRFL